MEVFVVFDSAAMCFSRGEYLYRHAVQHRASNPVLRCALQVPSRLIQAFPEHPGSSLQDGKLSIEKVKPFGCGSLLQQTIWWSHQGYSACRHLLLQGADQSRVAQLLGMVIQLCYAAVQYDELMSEPLTALQREGSAMIQEMEAFYSLLQVRACVRPLY